MRIRGGSRISGRGGLITIFPSGGGYGGGVPSPVTARGSGKTLIVPPVGPGAKAHQPLFLLLRFFSMKIHIFLTVISTSYVTACFTSY